MESASCKGDAEDPLHSKSYTECSKHTAPEKPTKKLALSVDCCLYYCFLVFGVFIVLAYIFLLAFWFIVNVRDSRVENVRQGEKSECTSFPDIFLAFFIMLGIFIPFSCFVAWLDPDSQCYTLMEFMKIILAALLLAIMFWGIDEYWHTEPDCEAYIKEVGGPDFWLASESFAYAMFCGFVLLSLFCVCSIYEACEHSRMERQFQTSYYRQIHSH